MKENRKGKLRKNERKHLRDKVRKANKIAREVVRAVIWKIAQDEGGHILHYNEWVDDNWDKMKKRK